LIRKECDQIKGVKKGIWDAMNLIDIISDKEKGKTTYKLTTTVIMEIAVKEDAVGDVDLAGHLQKNKTQVMDYDDKE